MSEKCNYPNCHAPMEVGMHRGGKRVQLCDLHLSYLLSENRKQAMQTEQLLKFPPAETGARMATMDEGRIYCCAPDCRQSAALFYGDKPVCHEHAPKHEYLPFDGVYRYRKMIAVERTGANGEAIVVTGEEKVRHKLKKIYPVNRKKAPVQDAATAQEGKASIGYIDGSGPPVASQELYVDGPPVASQELYASDLASPKGDDSSNNIDAILARLSSGELELEDEDEL